MFKWMASFQASRMFSSSKDKGSSSSPTASSPTGSGGWVGQLSAMGYQDKTFTGDVKLTTPVPVGEVIGEALWTQGKQYKIEWTAGGDFPHVELRLRKAGKNAKEHITLPGEGKSKEWLSIAERVQVLILL